MQKAAINVSDSTCVRNEWFKPAPIPYILRAR
jgi:hypothetical protein